MNVVGRLLVKVSSHSGETGCNNLRIAYTSISNSQVIATSMRTHDAMCLIAGRTGTARRHSVSRLSGRYCYTLKSWVAWSSSCCSRRQCVPCRCSVYLISCQLREPKHWSCLSAVFALYQWISSTIEWQMYRLYECILHRHNRRQGTTSALCNRCNNSHKSSVTVLYTSVAVCGAYRPCCNLVGE